MADHRQFVAQGGPVEFWAHAHDNHRKHDRRDKPGAAGGSQFFNAYLKACERVGAWN